MPGIDLSPLYILTYFILMTTLNGRYYRSIIPYLQFHSPKSSENRNVLVKFGTSSFGSKTSFDLTGGCSQSLFILLINS